MGYMSAGMGEVPDRQVSATRTARKLNCKFVVTNAGFLVPREESL
jgi:hypothetical protein